MVGTELETFFAFFVCVWLVPIVFSLFLEVSADSCDFLELDLARMSVVNGVLEGHSRKDVIVYFIDTVFLPQQPKIQIASLPEPAPSYCIRA